MKVKFEETQELKGGEFDLDLTAADLADNAEFIRDAAKAGIMTVIDGDTVIFPDNSGIYKPGDIVNSSKIWAVGGECFSGWITDESTNRKGTRIYEGKDRIDVVEYLRLALEYAEKAAETAASKAKSAADADIEAAYFAALPLEIAGFRRGHIGRDREIEDDCGNYVLTLPKKAAHEVWPVEKLAAWIDDQTAEGYGE